MDVSGSINDENISLAKKFAKTLLRRFRISRDNVRVSFVGYSESVKIYSTFEDDQEEEGLEQKVNNMFFEGSSTKTRKALSVLNNQLFVQKHGSRIEESGKSPIVKCFTRLSVGHDDAVLFLFQMNSGLVYFVVKINSCSLSLF